MTRQGSGSFTEIVYLCWLAILATGLGRHTTQDLLRAGECNEKEEPTARACTENRISDSAIREACVNSRSLRLTHRIQDTSDTGAEL